MIKNFTTSFALALTAFIAAGCGAGSLLQTGSISQQPGAAATAPKQVTPIDRALYVAATSARAHRCGFYFDPAALRTNVLAAETGRGTSGDLLTKAGQSYDYTASKVASSIKQSEAFCTKARTAAIRASLQRALAGDFDPPVKKVVAQSSGLADLFETDSAGPEKFNKEKIYDPVLNDDERY